MKDPGLDSEKTREQYERVINSLEGKLQKYEELALYKQLLLAQTNPGALIDMLAEAAARLINAETVAVPLLSPDNLQVTYNHAWGKHSGVFKGLSIPVEKAGLCGWVLENRMPILTNDLRDDPRVLKEMASALGINAAAVVPLVARGRIIGGISAFNRADGARFSEEDVQNLVKLADYAALLIDNLGLMDELSKEKVKLDAIFEGVNDGIIFISSEGIIKKANRSVERYLPLKADDMVGARVSDLSSMGRLEEVFNWSAKAEEGSRCYEILACQNLNCLLRKTDFLRCWLFSDGFCNPVPESGPGEEKVFERCSDCQVLIDASRRLSRPREVSIMGKTLQVSSTLAHDKKDRVFGEIIVIHDITAEKEVERQRTEFVSMVTNDLKAPLASIIGNCGIIEEEDDLGKVREVVRRQHVSSTRLLKMIEDFLYLKKIEGGNFKPDVRRIAVKGFLEDIVAGFQAQAGERGVHLAGEVKEDAGDVFADEDYLRRVVENLVSNSLKFAGEGRNVTVAASSSKERFIEITVTDDGPGISAKEINRLFMRHLTPSGDKDRPEGWGLGLAIARELTEAQGGTIRVKSEEGKGTVFYIFMPAPA